MPCHNCGRTFLPDRLQVHLRSCDKAYAKKAVGGGGEMPSLGDKPTNSNFSTPDMRNKAIKGLES